MFNIFVSIRTAVPAHAIASRKIVFRRETPSTGLLLLPLPLLLPLAMPSTIYCVCMYIGLCDIFCTLILIYHFI